MRRTHLNDKDVTIGGRGGTQRVRKHRTMCGRYEELGAAHVVDDPMNVSCLDCIRAVERANGDVTAESVQGRARVMARPPAISRLIDAHRDEFRRLVAEEAVRLIPVAIEEEEARRRFRARLDR